MSEAEAKAARTASLEDLEARMAVLRRLEGVTNTGGNAQTITVTANAGVFGVWVATTACLVMLACGLIGCLWVSREFGRYDAEIAKLQAKDATQAAYIQSIWRAAPQLKPRESEVGR